MLRCHRSIYEVRLSKLGHLKEKETRRQRHIIVRTNNIEIDFGHLNIIYNLIDHNGKMLISFEKNFS